MIPPKQNAEFVAAMEDVLEVYRRPYNEKRPVVCLDEQNKQLVKQVNAPMPMRPGADAKEDYEYERNGTANLFMCFEPLAGKRQVAATERRTKIDFAHQVKALVDVYYPQAEVIVLVMDNLNTHKIASLYEAFTPQEAWRLAQKLEIHYTPKHGSWLNMAETELSVLTKQCLDRRIADRDTLSHEVEAWTHARNARQAKINWQFTTEKARTKLKKLYPTFQE